MTHLQAAIYHLKKVKSDNPRISAMLLLLTELLGVANIESAQLELDLGEAKNIDQARRDIHVGTKREKLEYEAGFINGGF